MRSEASGMTRILGHIQNPAESGDMGSGLSTVGSKVSTIRCIAPPTEAYRATNFLPRPDFPHKTGLDFVARPLSGPG
jgi:hypothetical protein